jgi:hypothetical protein
MRYYVTSDGRVVDEGSPAAAFIVAPVDVKRLGLEDAVAAYEAAKVKMAAPPEDKMMPAPANKRRKRKTTKS